MVSLRFRRLFRPPGLVPGRLCRFQCPLPGIPPLLPWAPASPRVPRGVSSRPLRRTRRGYRPGLRCQQQQQGWRSRCPLGGFFGWCLRFDHPFLPFLFWFLWRVGVPDSEDDIFNISLTFRWNVVHLARARLWLCCLVGDLLA